jgi:hypothetical protein
VRQPPAAEVDDLLLGRMPIVLQGDERLRSLAPEVVGHRDHGAFQHRRMGDDRLLDLDAGDVLAAGVDDVLPAVAQLDVTVRMPDGEVAGVEPAAVEDLARGRLVLEVAAHHVVAPHDDLAHRPAVLRNVVHLVVDNADEIGRDVRLALA